MKKESILIVGASGTVGSEISRILKAQGHSVRGTTSKKSRASEKVFMDLTSGEGIKEGFEGIDRAFFLSPPGHADQYAMLSPLIQEAKRRGLKKVVLMTAMGANANEAAPFRRAEVELEKSGLAYNIIRPNWFLQNFNTFWVQGIREQAKIFLPAGTAKVSFIDARDVSAVAAVLLVDDSFNNQDFDLTGAEAVDHGQVANKISDVSGRQVTYAEISPESFKAGLLGAGLPEDYSAFMVMIMGFLKEGYSAGVTENVQKILGRKPMALAGYVQDFKTAFGA
ncbi:MAG TPA: NAD(P)H-binding protein [Bacteriovoracaceae bacterium]|nr:NAD(P)H-binding protein [Bacteriovoracaceae bacterium]